MKLSTTAIKRTIKASFRQPIYLLLAALLLCSHDLYIKMESYFLEPNQEATLSLYNGTFEKSENIITRDRMLDASVVAQGKRTAINSNNWKDQDSTITQFPFKTGEAGTYVVGVSTKARDIELTAEKFNAYLKSDGVFDMLEQRTNENLLNKDAVENYQKHVKAIYQVGDVKSNDWDTVLGYPIEFVPQENPYDKHSGETLKIQLLLDGKPAANQLVFADYVKSSGSHSHGDESDDHEHEHKHNGETHSHKHTDSDADHAHDHKSASKDAHEHEHKHNGESHSHKHSDSDADHDHDHKSASKEAHSHEHEHDGKKHSHEHTDEDEHNHAHQADTEEEHTHTSGQQLRTNSEGVVTIDLPEDGIYYLRTISMTTATDSDKLTHRSKWATLSFEVTHSHDADAHGHEHEHEDEIPAWVFVLGSFLVVGILFLIFRKKK